MIRITVEMVPGGVGEPVLLGRAIIANDGTGTKTRGNYRGTFWRKQRAPWRCTSVKNFPRQRDSVWHLLHQLLGEALGG